MAPNAFSDSIPAFNGQFNPHRRTSPNIFPRTSSPVDNCSAEMNTPPCHRYSSHVRPASCPKYNLRWYPNDNYKYHKRASPNLFHHNYSNSIHVKGNISKSSNISKSKSLPKVETFTCSELEAALTQGKLETPLTCAEIEQMQKLSSASSNNQCKIVPKSTKLENDFVRPSAFISLNSLFGKSDAEVIASDQSVCSSKDSGFSDASLSFSSVESESDLSDLESMLNTVLEIDTTVVPESSMENEQMVLQAKCYKSNEPKKSSNGAKATFVTPPRASRSEVGMSYPVVLSASVPAKVALLPTPLLASTPKPKYQQATTSKPQPLLPTPQSDAVCKKMVGRTISHPARSHDKLKNNHQQLKSKKPDSSSQVSRASSCSPTAGNKLPKQFLMNLEAVPVPLIVQTNKSRSQIRSSSSSPVDLTTAMPTTGATAPVAVDLPMPPVMWKAPTPSKNQDVTQHFTNVLNAGVEGRAICVY